MPDIESLVREGVLERLAALRDADARAGEIQRGLLRAILARNAGTEFGEAHGFAAIDTPERYAAAVPPSTAADYASAWRRIAAGATNVLFADPVRAIALSSGTTGEAKRVPLTEPVVRGLTRVVGHCLASSMGRIGNFSILRGYALQLAASPEVGRTPAGIPVGYVTGIMGALRAYPYHNIGVPSADLLAIPDWAEKFARIAERHAGTDVRMLFGVPTYALAFLRLLLEGAASADTRAVWPHLGLVLTSGVALAPYRERLARLCPGAELLEMYLATEAPLAFQGEPGAPLTPMLEEVYFEFVPEERWGEERPPRFPLEETEPGVAYILLVTTPGGLYAYSLGDVVRVVSRDPPRFEVSGRVDGALNLATEKLDGAQAARALRAAGLSCVEFTVCPAAGEQAAHEWVVEFSEPPPHDATALLDRALAAANPSYASLRRGDLVLGPPQVTAVRPGTFAAALCRRPGQGKILRIYPNRKVRDELAALARELP
ncbi:MAG: GH3 family domain-containing protein [Planctomycetaceae bacterium]